ncbi:hypothetical protein FQN49_003179 [Arthroderma sp. PD_2]|nr:hypothetical protein FQN49_003179 [Arthroderma sp. PD_2]
MSLITDEMLNALWLEAQRKPSDESAAMAVWSQLWNKHIFCEKEWIIAPESPPRGNEGRMVNITIKYLGENREIAVLAFHEAKAMDAGPQCIQDAEHQAVEACMRYLGKAENAGVSFVYAITSFGTKGRAWRYEAGNDYLTPLFGPKSLAADGDYIELHSSDAMQLRQAFSLMKNAKPSC